MSSGHDGAQTSISASAQIIHSWVWPRLILHDREQFAISKSACHDMPEWFLWVSMWHVTRSRVLTLATCYDSTYLDLLIYSIWIYTTPKPFHHRQNVFFFRVLISQRSGLFRVHLLSVRWSRYIPKVSTSTPRSDISLISELSSTAGEYIGRYLVHYSCTLTCTLPT